MTAEGQSDKMVSDMEVRMKQRCVTEFLHSGKIAPNEIHRCLLNVYGDQTVDVSTVRRRVARFSSGDSDAKDKPRSGRPRTAVTPWNEERLDQLIHANRQITTREKPSTLTATSRRWLSWRLEFPESGQRRRQPFSCNTTTPGPIPVWRPWSTLPILGGMSYHTYYIVRIWPLLTSICSSRWKMDCMDIFLATAPLYELWNSGPPPMLQIFTRAAYRLLFIAGESA